MGNDQQHGEEGSPVTAADMSTPAGSAADAMAALARVMARVTADAGSDGALGALARGLVDEFGVALARIWLHDPAADTIHQRAAAGLGGELPGSVISLATAEGSPIIRAIRTRQPVVIDPITSDSGFDNPEWVLGNGLRYYAGSPLFVGERLAGALAVFLRERPAAAVTQALEVVAQQAALVLEHARIIDESHRLQTVAADLASARDTDALLEAIVTQTLEALGGEACAVWLLNEAADLRVAASRGLADGFETALITARRANQGAGVFEEIQRTGQPMFTRDDIGAARTRNPAQAEALAAAGVVSALRLPLFEPGGAVQGMVALYHHHERLYSEGEIRLAQAFADQIAVALHNARLAGQERRARDAAARQVERLAALARITEELIHSSDVEAMLQVVVSAAVRLCGAGVAVVALADPERTKMSVVAQDGPLQPAVSGLPRELPLVEPFLSGGASGLAFAMGETVSVGDYATWGVVTEAQAGAIAAGVRAVVAAPLRVGEQSVGVLWVGDATPNRFAGDDIQLVETLADQAALAIEHARLGRRGQEAAVLEERARLARDLHDSVTQSLFSLSMMAKAAHAQHARKAPALGGTLERISTLSQQALTEMRALLFELRPSALAEEGLSGALDKLAASYRVRFDLPLRFEGGVDVRLDPDVETAMFRIVQEALNNAVKHAGAKSVDLWLEAVRGRLRASVEDDGAGFEVAALSAVPSDGRQGGMGLLSMRERAAAAGLALRIESTPGKGTTVTVEAPLPEGASPPRSRRARREAAEDESTGE